MPDMELLSEPCVIYESSYPHPTTGVGAWHDVLPFFMHGCRDDHMPNIGLQAEWCGACFQPSKPLLINTLLQLRTRKRKCRNSAASGRSGFESAAQRLLGPRLRNIAVLLAFVCRFVPLQDAVPALRAAIAASKHWPGWGQSLVS